MESVDNHSENIETSDLLNQLNMDDSDSDETDSDESGSESQEASKDSLQSLLKNPILEEEKVDFDQEALDKLEKAK